MRKRAAALVAVAASTPAAATAGMKKPGEHLKGCNRASCDQRIGRKWWVAHHPKARKASVYTANSTSYCLNGTMSDGTQVRPGSVASNWHALGTRIRLLGTSFFGAREFVVRDRIGSGSDLDFWASSCPTSLAWGRRPVTYVVVG